MADSWTTSSVDLFLSIEPRSRRMGLEKAIREGIADGRLVQGARLPSSRALARDLGVARGTVIEAYSQLTAEGYLTSRHGSGTWVSVALKRAPVPQVGDQRSAPLHDFRPGTPDLSLFPRAAWLASARRALATAQDSAFGRSDPRGRIELRTALAAYLGRARGVRADPGSIVICSGFAHALPLLARALFASGTRRLFAEDPGLPRHRRAVRAQGLEVVSVPVDESGLRPDFGDEQYAAVLVTPAHQFPFGMTMQRERRAQLATWAQDTNSVVIEDDYDGEFRFDRQPAGALQGLAPGFAVYCGTASKTLIPGLRLGWLVVPAALLGNVVDARIDSGQDASVLDQLTLADFISSGAYDRHIRRARAAYRRRRDALLAMVREAAPGVVPGGIAGGLHVVLHLPGGAAEERTLLAKAAERSIGLHGLGPCYDQPELNPGGLIIGYATPPGHAFENSLIALAALLGSHYL